MIDLKDTVEPLRDLIENSLASFPAEHPDVTWCTFSLYACPWAGWVSTCFDTEENSARIVDKFSSNGPDWYGEDVWGQFNNNCPDFMFPEWRLLDLEHWRTEYEEAEPIHVRDLDGQDHFIGDEYEAINGLAFVFMRTVLRSRLNAMKGRSRLPDYRHRIGVQLLDSELSEFWRN